MGEFWSWPKYMEAFSCTEMTSAGHVYGKKIVGAESFTATDAEKWQGYPGNIKDLGDWAFCEGINRFVFHRYAMQPWTQGARPGMSMGPWGLHYERTETWWEQSAAWHQYLARCQFLLQQGLFVADLCLLSPEGSPQTIDRQESFISKLPGSEGQPLDRPGHNFDLCPPEVVLNRMSVRDGKLLLPDGMSYRLLALPQCDTMTPALLRKIKELVKEGATIAGARPLQSPSLSGYPGCDQELKSLAAELWGTEEIKAEVAERTYGKGRILCGTQFEQARELNRRPPGEVSAAKWVWKNEGNPAVAAPVGPRYFRKLVKIEGGAIKSAQLVMTADNSFQCWINGQPAARGEDFNRLYHADVARLLHPGTNLLTVTGVNGGDQPNPAGILGQLTVQFQDGSKMIISTDASWEAASNVNGDWRKDFAVDNHWSPALELGAVGMAPWGNPEKADAGRNLYPDLAFLGQLLGERGLPEDFSYVAQSGEPCLRFIHKRIGKTEIYFVANKTPRRQKASCSFRVIGKRPELWWPEHGEIQRQAQYNATADGIQMPLRLESCESVFVVFQDRAESNPIVSATRDGEPAWVALDRTTRHKFAACIAQAGHYALTAENGKKAQFDVAPLSAPWSIEGPWQVEFAGGSSGPGRAIFQSLGSWSDQTDPAVKYFSGTATYTRTFAAPAQLLGRDRRLFLDLGKVAVIADVSLNGQKLGTLWNAPYRVEITGAIKPGENTLSVKVANLWINRQIGDELLPEDSDRNANGTLKQWPEWLQTGGVSPTGRQSFTSWRLWKRNDPLQESGLLGPVRIVSAQAIEIRSGDFH